MFEEQKIFAELNKHGKLLEQIAQDIAIIKTIIARVAPPMTRDQQKASIDALIRKTRLARDPSKK